jgi:hypothetical protein
MEEMRRETDGRQYLVERRGGCVRRREVIRRELDDGDEWLSYAGIALVFQIPLGVVEHRQAGKGWRGNSWMPLRSTLFTAADSLGRRRELPFIRKSAVQKCLDCDKEVKKRFSTAGDETLERFKCNGRWVLIYSRLRHLFGCGLGKRLRDHIRRAELVPEKIRHPLTGKPVEVFPEAKVLLATDAREAARDAEPPDLRGRATMWFREFLEGLREARGQEASLRWDMPYHWLEASSRHLDGRKMRSGQLKEGRKERYVDREDAELVLASVRAETRGSVSSGRRALTAGEAERLLGLTRMQVGWAAGKGQVKKLTTIGRTHLYDRGTLESLCIAKLAGPRPVPDGYASGEQLRRAPEILQLPFERQRFVPSRLQEFRATRKQGLAWRPVRANGFIYHLKFVIPFLLLPAAAPRRRGRRRKDDRRNIWVSWRKEGLSYGAIRDRWNLENPGDPISDGKNGKDLVKKTIKTALAATAR